jgi:uncharacterized Rmd1/YagE family protein
MTALSEAEEDGYQGSYFTQPIKRRSSVDMRDGYISSTSPVLARTAPAIAVFASGEEVSLNLTSDAQFEGPGTSSALLSDTEPWTDSEVVPETITQSRALQKEAVPPAAPTPQVESSSPNEDEIVEVVFFEYGVAVFFGLTEGQEKDILEDIENAGIMKRKIPEDDWEVEECHFAVRW